MDWIFYSAVMFVGSVVYYLLVKKVQDLGVDRYLYMATTSIVPAIAYALIGLIDGQSFIMSPLGFLIIFINAAFLNYFGSITGFIGIKTAPNAGYSVIIQKSYAIYTSILAVFLFDSELPFYKVLAILIILFFTGLIVIERSNEKFKIGKWVVYSFIAFLLFGGTTIAAKYAAKIGEDPNIFLFWVMLVTASISIVEALRNKSKITIKLNTKIIIWLFLMSASVTVFYWGKNLSSITAPNVGYTGAINASSNAALAIASALIYKQEFKLIKILGIFGVIAGLIVLIY